MAEPLPEKTSSGVAVNRVRTAAAFGGAVLTETAVGPVVYLATGLVGLRNKFLDSKAKKQEELEERHRVGSDLARDAFINQTRMIEDAEYGRDNVVPQTPIRYESPEDIGAVSPASTTNASTHVADGLWHGTVVSAMSPTPDSPSSQPPPPPYSLEAEYPPITDEKRSRSPSDLTNEPVPSPIPSPSIRGPVDLASTRSVSESNSSTLSGPRDNPTTLRIRTVGSKLDSGFPYHPALFDLQIHPTEWDRFTHQIVTATKLSPGDTAQMVAAATATALTGAFGTSIWVGRTMNRKLREKRVQAGMLDMKDGGLGDILERWNNDYFRTKSLSAHLELSESAMKSQEQRSKSVRLHSSLYGRREDRERKREERKFVLVVSKLDEEGLPTTVTKEVQEDESPVGRVEAEGSYPGSLPTVLESADKKIPHIPEMPANETIAELPAEPIAELYGSPVDEKVKPADDSPERRKSTDSLSSDDMPETIAKKLG